MDIKKIIQNNGVAITVWVVGVAFAVLNVYIASKLTPLAKDLALMDTKVEAYEDRLKNLENNSVSQGERKMVLDRLDRIENKVDRLIEEK